MENILLSHGSGGVQTHRLLETVFRPAFHRDSPKANRHDAAYLAAHGGTLAFTTDSFVISPLFFPGGDIGKLALCGTINDLAVSGARPLWLSASFILEEGLPLETLSRVVESMAQTAREAGVEVVTGDTKVVERGKGDGIYINTSGIGLVSPGVDTGGHRARPGDIVIVSGTIGEHGLAVMACREGLRLDGELTSDCAPLHGLCQAALANRGVRVMRDPTRGGLATTLNEIAKDSGVGIEIFENDIPVSAGVEAACAILGLDPLYAANEGKVVFIVEPLEADNILEKIISHPLGAKARKVGKITWESPGRVWMRTRIGGTRMVGMLTGDLLPRIC